MALNWDEMIGRNFGNNGKRSWDELMGTNRTSSSQSISYGNTIPRGYEGTEYEGMTNDEIVQRVAEKQRYYDAEEKQRRQQIVEEREARERAIQEAAQQRERERQQQEIDRLIRESTEYKADRDNPSGLSAEEKAAMKSTQNEQPQSKGWFFDFAKGLKDTIVSIPASIFSTGQRNREKIGRSGSRKKRSN